jgi:hypothetical protein
MSIRLLHRGNLYGLTGPYSETLKRIAKETPGMQWSPPARAWVGYSDAVAVVVKRCREEGVNILGDVDTSTDAPSAFAISYESLRDYQKIGVDFLVAHAREGALLSDDVGCLAADSMVHINRASLTRHFRIADVFARFEKTWRADIPTYVKSMAPDGSLHLHRMKAVLYRGVKETVRVTLASGKAIRVTPDHEIATPKGFIRADKLRRGSVVLTNGKPVCKRCGTMKNVAKKMGTNSFPGYCRTCIYRHLRKKPNWIGGRHSDGKGYILVSGQQAHPRSRSGRVFEHRLVMEKHLGRYLRDDEIVHHKNGDGTDNRLENLELLTSHEHMIHHGRHGGFRNMHGGTAGRGGRIWFVAAEDKVVSVEAAGSDHVYDIVCEDPYRNFVANGIIVHNCGKSAQALRTARAFKDKAVIVCPSFVRGVWEAEIAKWWPAAKVEMLSTTKPWAIDSTTDVCVIHYDVLHAWVEALIAWGVKTMIADEIHYLMSGTSRRTKAAEALARSCPQRIGLSATPMTSRPKDLWAPVNVLSEGRFGRLFSFALRHCDAHREQVTPTKTVWKLDGASNLDELQERLKFFMLRRTKSDVALELPERVRQVLELDVAKGCMISPTAALRSDRIMRTSLDMAADGKIPQVIDLVVNHIEGGHKVVCFTYRKAIAHAIVEGVNAHLAIKSAIITGDVEQGDRRKIIVQQPSLLAATMDSTSVGIDLSYADVAVFAELDWVPSKLVQSEGRLHRFGQKRSVLIQYCVARGTGDDVVRRVILDKLARFEEGVGKLDDGLKTDFASKVSAVERMKKLYERLLASENAA